MTHDESHRQERVVPGDRALIFSIVRSMADVTWRMFAPPALLVPLGIWADLSWRTKPWFTILATIVGLSLSVVLVRQLLRSSQ